LFWGYAINLFYLFLLYEGFYTVTKPFVALLML